MRPLLLLACSIAAHAAAQPRVEIGTPVPAWVEPVQRPASDDAFEGDIEELLLDEQWRVEADRSARFRHSAYRVRALTGVQRGSELSIRVESDERLDWHYVLRHRDGATARALHPRQVRVIQPETGLGGGVYDASRRAILFVEDVRVGDVIEYAYTVWSPLQVLGGRFAARFPLGQGERLRRLHVSLRWPRHRAIQARAHPGSLGLELDRGVDHLRVSATDIAAPPQVGHTPAWYRRLAWLEVSELDSWARLVEWALPLYTTDGQSLEGVPLHRFREARTPEARLLLALRFVQDEIRYLGLEVDEHTLVPHPPALVAQRRFGDCKDKARLLVAILRALGIEAHAALVSTSLRHTVDSQLPSPFAFDHVIVRATIGEREHWLDPTSSHERGPLAARPPPPFGRALVIRDGEAALVPIPTRVPDEPDLDIVERFDLRTFDVETTYRGREASAQRADLESTPRDDVQRAYLDFYRARGLEVSVRAPLEVHDDETLDAVRVVEHYELTNADDDLDASAWSILDALPLPSASRAAAPFALSYPRHLRHRTEVRSSAPWTPVMLERTIEGPGFTLAHSEHTVAHLSTRELTLRTSADHVPAERVAEYAERAREARTAATWGTGEVTDDPVQGTQEPEGDPTQSLIALGGVLGMIGMIFVVSRVTRPWWLAKRKRAFERAQVFATGEGPETAIPVRDDAEAEQKLPPQRCCNALLGQGSWTRVRFGGGTLRVNTRTCKHCGEIRRRYYRLSAARPGGSRE